MRRTVLNLPTFGLAVATRAALGTGIGLLVAGKLTPDFRRRVGLALVGIGAATTIPVVRAVLRGRIEAGKGPLAPA